MGHHLPRFSICLKSKCVSRHGIGTDKPQPRRRAPGHATHIAGYVPPKGSIALSLLGRVVKYS